MSKWSSKKTNYWQEDEKKDERDMNNNRFESINEHFPIRQSFNQIIPRQISHINVYKYENAYSESFQLDIEDLQRENLFFSSNKPIYVQIVDNEQESSLLVLQRTVYIIRIIYDSHEWTIRKRFKNFLKLYETFALFKAKQNLKSIAHLHAGPAPSAPTSANKYSKIFFFEEVIFKFFIFKRLYQQ